LNEADWPDQNSFLFDHITVTAQSTDGTQHGAACLFYSEEAEKEVQSDSDMPTACADLHTAAWIGPPSLPGWSLAETPRTLNFVFPSGTDVTVSAIAGLGGRLEVGAANGAATASVDYPEIALSLTPLVPSISADCRATLNTLPEDYPDVRAQPDLCLSPDFRGLRGCQTDEQNRARTLPEGHASSMTCVRTASRIDGIADLPCPGDDPSLAWRSPIPDAIATCMDVQVTGHFVRCASFAPSGECQDLTTDCTPPLAELGVVQNGAQPESVRFSCLPPFAQPITFVVRMPRVPITGPEDVALFFHPIVGGTDKPCFFDLYSL
jgi:hypothetical protein